MLVPAAVQDLHHAGAALDEPAPEALCVKLPARLTSGPYRSSVALLSLLRSVSSGTLVCMRKAISYWAMRVCDLGIADAGVVDLVELVQRVEHRAAVTGIDAGRVLHIQHGVALTAQATPVYLRRQKPLLHMRVNSACA
jgi:hypothetical protein